MKKNFLQISVLMIGLFAVKQSHAQATVMHDGPNPAATHTTNITLVNGKWVVDGKPAEKAIDSIYKGKYGPKDQTIFVDKDLQYYYFDAKGEKVYCTKNQLKSKKAHQ